MEQAINKALESWKSGDNDILHAALGLVGEAGELIELYKKDQFKPGYSWWNCKRCGKHYKYDDLTQKVYKFKQCECDIYTPLILDELGDWFYYWRILVHLEALDSILIRQPEKHDNILIPIKDLMDASYDLLDIYLNWDYISTDQLIYTYQTLIDILCGLDTTLDHLTELNYQKLNSEPTHHGWILNA